MNPVATALLSGPSLLLLMHLASAVLTLNLRRRPVPALLTGFSLALLVILVLSELNLDPGTWTSVPQSSMAWTMPRLDLTLVLDASILPVLILMHTIAAITFLLSLLGRQSGYFLPGMFLLLMGYSLILMLETGPLLPVFLSPLFLVPLTAWSPGFPRHRMPMFRKIVLAPLLAMPCFVLAHWIIFQQMPADPQSAELVHRANVLLTAGLFVLCLPFPFYQLLQDETEGQAVMPSVAADLLYQFLALAILHSTLLSHPPLRDFEPLHAWLGWAAVITVIWSGLAALGLQQPQRIWFYASMLNWGMILLVFTLPLPQIWETMLSLFLLRGASLLACITGLMHLDESRLRAGAGWEGLGNSQPWSMALFLLGALGLVGFPLTSSFGHFWITWQFIATIDWPIAFVLALGTALAAIGLIRVLRILLRPQAESPPMLERMSQRLQAAVWLILLTYLSFVPQTLDPFMKSLLVHFQ